MVFIIALLVLLTQVTAVSSGQEVYVVRPGDTLYAIARQYGLGWEELADYNQITDPRRLWVGSELRIPDGHLEYVQGHGYLSSETLVLARLIYAEARGESLEGQVAVGAVVLNRVKSCQFPDTIEAVVFQEGQFIPAGQDLLPGRPSAQSLEAARRALAGEDPTQGALFFYNPSTTTQPEFWRTRQVIRRIGNHNFAL